MMWVALALALVLILTLASFLAILAFVSLNYSESINALAKSHKQSVADLTKHHEASQTALIETHEEVLRKIIDGPKLPEIPQMMETRVADEEWIASPESIITQGDDLSPFFDPDE